MCRREIPYLQRIFAQAAGRAKAEPGLGPRGAPVSMTAQATAPPQLVKSAASLIFTMPERKVLTGGGPSLHAPGQLSAASQADLDRTQVRELLCEASRRPDVAALVLAAAETRAHPAEACLALSLSWVRTSSGASEGGGFCPATKTAKAPVPVVLRAPQNVRTLGQHARAHLQRAPLEAAGSALLTSHRPDSAPCGGRQVAQLADEAAEAVHLLDGGGEGRAGGARLVTDALDKVAAKAEGLLRAGRGPLALEALVAVAGEVVRPDEVPGAAFAVLRPFCSHAGVVKTHTDRVRACASCTWR